MTVTTNAETATITGGFSVLAGLPQLVSATPNSAQAGSTLNVVINGEFTTFQQGFSTVAFGPGITVNSVAVSSIAQLTANISINSNANLGSRDVTVTTNSQSETLSGGFTVTAGTPAITQINPNIGVPGQTVAVTIYGQYTNWVQGTTTASFGPSISVGGAAEGATGPVTVTNATTLTANLTIDPDASFGPVDVIVTTGTEVENVAAGFTVQPVTISPPTVVSVSPAAFTGGMPTNSNIIVVFSQPMDRSTINASNVLLYLTSNREMAEDLFQEVWMRVLVRGGQFNGKARFDTWLFTIARNLVIDQRRKRTMASLDELFEGGSEDDRPMSFEIAAGGPTPFDSLSNLQDRERIAGALMELDTLHREVLVLRFHEELSLEEIAKVTRAPLSTVKSRLYRGMAAIKPKLERNHPRRQEAV